MVADTRQRVRVEKNQIKKKKNNETAKSLGLTRCNIGSLEGA